MLAGGGQRLPSKINMYVKDFASNSKHQRQQHHKAR